MKRIVNSERLRKFHNERTLWKLGNEKKNQIIKKCSQ